VPVLTRTPLLLSDRDRRDRLLASLAQRTRSVIAASATAEKEKIDLPPQKVLRAVERLGGGRVTAGDVATESGTSLFKAQQGLVNLASLTGAAVEVSEQGDLCYRFPSGVRGVLLQRSFKQRLIQTWGSTWPVALYITRVAFGVMLFASITALTITIATLATAANQRGDDDDGGDSRPSGFGGFGGFNFFYINLGPSPFDFMRYNYPYRTAYQNSRSKPWQTRGYDDDGEYAYQRAERQRLRQQAQQPQTYADEYGMMMHEEEPQMGILPAIFSYVFGDGVPTGLDEERLSMIAEMIRRNGGAVVAEQIAPYLYDPKGDVEDKNKLKDDQVVPILQALKGYPEVTGAGTIVYVFPELSTSSIARSRAPMPPAFFSEPTIKFSEAPTGQRVKAGALCAVNLVLALWLGNILKKYAALGIKLPGFLGTMQELYPVLLIYAVALNGIPAARAIFLAFRNAKINARNENRRRWATTLKSDPGTIDRVKEANQYSPTIKTISDADIVYSTDTEMDDYVAEKGDPDFNDFDKKLGAKPAGARPM